MKIKSRSILFISAIPLAALLLAASLYARWSEPRIEPLVTSSGRRLGGFCGAASKTLCRKRLQCKQLEERQLDACVDQVGAECERSLGWKLAAGVLAVDTEAQEECLEAMGEAGCNALQAMQGDDEPDLFELTNRCELGELLKPRSGLGDPCAESSDCTAGFCPGLALECHRCRPYARAGQPCRAGELECDPASAFCSAGSAEPDGQSLCQALGETGAPCSGAHQCRARACRGGACGGAAAGAACSATADCANNRFCMLAAGHGVCTERAKTGEACVDQESACAEREASCVAGKCRVRPFLLSEGSACRDFTDCQDGLYCQGSKSGNVEGRCLRQAGAGGSCDHLDYGSCSAGTACHDDKCRSLRGLGEKCSSPFQCKAFLSCLPLSLEAGFKGGASCAPSPRVGERCNPNLVCVASFCDPSSGKCVALAGGGVRCLSSEQCNSGWCAGPRAQATCYAPCLSAKPKN